ncbi:MAG TPA: gamma-glutamyltransferase [Thermoanaerobaculia bacterium]|nr:gamma-glutamyltransferase [Thermoanaerobaculia bacterium]
MRQPMIPLSFLALAVLLPTIALSQGRTAKPVLHGKKWMAITGKPLGATAGAMVFQKGGNAVDAAAAMIAATSTMWDTLGWGGETQALIYNPRTRKVIGINGLGVAPTGATAEFFTAKGMRYPPEFGPLAATTPGTPGAIMVMVAEWGRLSLGEVLAPAIELADGFPIEAQLADTIERRKELIRQWPYSAALFLPNRGRKAASPAASPEAATAEGPAPIHDRPVEAIGNAEREGPEPGSMFRQPDLAATLRKLVETEAAALRAGKSRKDAIYAAYDRFYKGDVAEEIVRSVREQGGLFTREDLANWSVKIEEPATSSYRGIDVYKLQVWTQGPALLQALNILENFDLQPMGYNSARYIHTLYQTMNLAFADRDFYYGDIYSSPEEPVRGLLSKAYAKSRADAIDPRRNDPKARPGDPYPFQGGKNPFLHFLRNWPPAGAGSAPAAPSSAAALLDSSFYAGTTTVQAADEEGWVVSVTPSGGWIPAVIAGRSGIGLSQRMQSFVTDPAENPYNVVAPGRRPRVTLTPSIALRDGEPLLSFAVQGGDSQDQNLLQFFLNVVEFGMNVQEAAEAPNFNSFQMRSSFGSHENRPGRILLNDATPSWVRRELRSMGYSMVYAERTSGPINAIWFDREHGTMWGGSSHHGEDYGIAW